MALRNAFAKLVTESVEGALEAIFTRIDERLARQAIMEQPRDLQYARTTTDAMRVNVENFTTLQVNPQPRNDVTNGVIGQTAIPFGPGAVFMVDEREQQRIQSEQQFNQVRIQRWVIS
jgi:hypothetical protein